MLHKEVKPGLRATFCCFFLLTVVTSSVSAKTTTYRLDNGMQVILKENHGSPMVSSIIFVRSGSKYESQFENGITHFLEHLLFNGTINQSREELDRSVRNLGGYINAFTRKDQTTFLVLMPRQFIDYGLAVQVDMLFNSIIPEDELVKERKVVIEEIKRSDDTPGAAAEAFFTQMAYAGTDYDRPVLGYQPFIENIPKKAIADYWKRYYRPGNMTALIIGDFETEAIKQQVASILGAVTDTVFAAVDSLGVAVDTATADTRRPGKLPNLVYDTVANVSSTYIDFSFAAPHHSDSAYLPFDLLTLYLGMEGASPLLAALTGGALPLATEVGINLIPYQEFSRLEVSIITDNPENRDAIISTVLNELKGIGRHAADPETLAGIKTTVKCDDIYYSQKLHFYAFIISPLMMSAGWDFIQTYPERLAEVTWPQCQEAAHLWLADPDYVATVVRPAVEPDETPFEPTSITADEVIAYFDTATFADHDLSVGHPLTFPPTDSISLELVDRAEYHHEVMPNGLTLMIKSSPDSRVFAMNVLGKNRTANEPEGKAGITDFVNHCIEKGTVTRDERELSRDLARIGANVTLYDNPWIPYDDRYTTRRFSFLKFETIDEFAEKGFHLFCEMLLRPAFDSSEVENVRRSLLGVLGRDSQSPRKAARNLFFETVFEGKSYARPIPGNPMSIASISADDLREHHDRFYSPENMIISIATNKPIATVRKWAERSFGRLTSGRISPSEAKAPEPILEIRSAHTELGSKQTSLYLGSILPGATSPDVAAIKIATSILSSRLAHNLREKQGLAYSVGAGSVFDKNFGWLYCTISTRPENYQRAIDGILLEIEKLRFDGPMPSEIATARNQFWGRLSSAKLSRINQAYYLAVDEYLGREPGHDQRFLEALSQVTVDDIRRVTALYFHTDAYVLSSAGPSM